MCRVFDGCREVLDFSIYYKSCQYDACYGGDTVCASLELIAETCNMLGFCIDWRGLTNGVCSECDLNRSLRNVDFLGQLLEGS